MSILETFDFSRFRPQVFVIETLTYTEDNSERKEQDIIRHMESVGYMTYADTYVNTLFVDRAAWQSRCSPSARFEKWNSPHPYFAESATAMSAFTV